MLSEVKIEQVLVFTGCCGTLGGFSNHVGRDKNTVVYAAGNGKTNINFVEQRY